MSHFIFTKKRPQGKTKFRERNLAPCASEGYDKIDLSKHTFRFENQLYFIGLTDDVNSPFETSYLQLW